MENECLTALIGGYDSWNDGDYDDTHDIAPGDTVMCTECLCKGMQKFNRLCSILEKLTYGDFNPF